MPDVSVIVPVYNCREYLPRCIDSLVGQSIGTGRLEVVAVDDGSTDGSAGVLDEYAARHPGVVRVLREPNSGGPSRPRNLGIEHARGRYVFFCDADDWLGPEALERMVAMADRNDSDIVLGKIVGVGRSTPVSMFKIDRERTTLLDSTVYNSLAIFKLFRRDFLDRHKLRFDEDRRLGEDLLFAAHAYLHAEVISVVASHDCYHLVGRPDGTSITQEDSSRDPLALLPLIREPIDLMAAHVPPGELRDHLLTRHFRWDILAKLDDRYVASDSARRTALAESVAALCGEWLTPGVLDRLPPLDRLRVHCAREGLLDELAEILTATAGTASVRDGRAYAGLPYHGDPRFPDELFELRRLYLWRRLDELDWSGDRLRLRGHAYIEHLDPDGSEIELVLRDRETDETHVYPAESTGRDFTCEIDLPAAPGLWDVSVTSRVSGIERTGRLGADRDESRTGPPARVLPQGFTAHYYTTPYGNLTIDIGGRKVSPRPSVRLTRAARIGRRLQIEAALSISGQAPGEGTPLALLLVERATDETVRIPVTSGPSGLAAVLDPIPLASGTWDAYLWADLGGNGHRWRLPVSGVPLPAPATWRQGLRLRTARPYATNPHGNLSLKITSRSPLSLLRRAR
ncbi:glycosyltransferase family 2 protein [Bailinhaonella thermotolerans]|uniref:Glycosyltransferase family 2 protein n=1 Tax=Bailinhaonella thermotolerans TaxID=1070861 RepID=A0A3A4B028_9ACTN|nr:glycosyltransferase family 2 protein [Bailinhaonella thermotolerans]RJL30810.1 glycosyltransferase family 2 protein [Bailinhaonella thermotolerans]